MKTRNRIIIGFIIFSSLAYCGCGKTETDKEWENTLIGYWIPQDGNGNTWDPCYVFSEGHRGYTFIKASSGDHHEFGWEIKRKQLKTIYDEMPPYAIGYDKYNRQGVYKIKSVEPDKIRVIQLTYDGIQRDFYLIRGSLDNPEESE